LKVAGGEGVPPANGGATTRESGNTGRQGHPEQMILEAGLTMTAMSAAETAQPVVKPRRLANATSGDAPAAETGESGPARLMEAVWANLSPVNRPEGTRSMEAGVTANDGAPAAQSLDAVSRTEVAGVSKAAGVAQMIAEATDFKGSLDRAVQQQVLVRLTQAVRNGETEFRLRLHPEALGRVDANLFLGRESLSLALTAETPQARQALQQGLPELRAALEQTGVQVGQCNVGLMNGQNGGGQWFSQEGHRSGFTRPAFGSETQGDDRAPVLAGAYRPASTALIDVTI
jgi:flagellar hook-length control protein FliK